MKLSDNLTAEFDAQITLELQASIVYRQLGIALGAQGLPGMASWMRHQAEEEVEHANRFIDHVVDRGGAPRIGAIEAPDIAPDATVLQLFQAALAHEEMVSEAIRQLYRSAEAAGDLDSRPLLNWFIEEQIEEESTVGEIIGRITRIDDFGPGLLRLDAQLGERGDD